MNNNDNRNREARLAPLTEAEYSAVKASKRKSDPAICPCCAKETAQGWLDDLGCCYHCAATFDRPDTSIPVGPRLNITLVARDGRYVLGFF